MNELPPNGLANETNGDIYSVCVRVGWRMGASSGGAKSVNFVQSMRYRGNTAALVTDQRAQQCEHIRDK